jgi:hypothetical protein
MQTIIVPQSVRAATAPEIELKIASTREERQGAFELIYRSYLRAGLCTDNEFNLRATPYQLLATTDIFVAKHRDEVISTVSLVRDGELGLPMEEIYPKEVAERRAAGVRVAEVSCLADRRRDTSRFFALFVDLSRLMAQLAVKTDVDELLIAVHPRHVPLYQRYMAFRRLGDQRAYPAVQANPAVALVLNFSQAQVESPKSWKEFFGQQLADSTLQSSPISREDQEHFRSILEAEPNSLQGFMPAAVCGGNPTRAGALAMCS